MLRKHKGICSRRLQFEGLEHRNLLSITPSADTNWIYDENTGAFISDASELSTSVLFDLGAVEADGADAGTSAAATYSADYEPIEVDPASRLMNAIVLGEWNGATLDGWTVANAASSSVADGSLTVTSPSSSANPVQIDLRSISGGPYLDYGYFDYLQIRLRLPVGFDKDVTFSFGTTTKSGFADDRTFSIPGDQLVTDGQWHTYRLDLGLVVWWRDTLRDLRIQPLGDTGAGETVSIDYVEVGDLPGDVLTAYTADLNMAPGVTGSTRQSVESKHFVFWWDPAVNPGGRTNWSTMQRNALRMLEESYQVYIKVLGYLEPFSYVGDGLRHKVNLTTWYSGYWMGGPYLNVDTSGLQDENWGNPIPHEFAHVVDGQQPGYLAGGHWESHANYMRENRTTWFAPLFASDQQSTMEINPLAWSNYRQDANRLIYADYRIFLALQDYAQELGLDPCLGAELWSAGNKNMTVYDKLATLLPSGVSIKDVVGTVMRYWPMLDFVQREAMRNELWTTAAERADYEYRTGSLLIPESDQSGWYMVPLERAPEKYAYMFHDLTPTSTTVTVELRGLDLFTTDEDWRWSLAAVDDNDNVRYSDVWGAGTHSFTLNPGENRVLLIVVATPDDTSLDLDSFYNTKPTDKSADRLRYPYEVRIEGATPASEQLDVTTSAGHVHSNGGGWVANTAYVASTAYVGPNARVLGTARVTGYARIEDYAVIMGNARVSGYARVYGYAVVQDSAIVSNYARVLDHAMVTGSSQVQGYAIVEEYARIGDSAVVKDTAIVRGDAYLFGSGVLSGTAIADYDYSMYFNLSDGTQFSHIPWGDYYDAYFAQTQTKPRGLVASYRVEETAGELMWDEFGAMQAVLRGSPGRVEDAFFNSKVLELNGVDQYALLDRSVADLTDASFAMWIKPANLNAGETLLYFGSTADTYLKLVARDEQGFAHLTISVNGQVKELASTQAIVVGFWTHVALTFGSGQVKFYINGQLAGTMSTTFRPDDVLGPDDYINPLALYLGRDDAGNFFTGRLEDVRFYNVTLSQDEVAGEMNRCGAKIGQFYADSAATFDGSTTMMESGVHNGLARTLSAWIKPNTSDDVSYYEPVLDSNDELNSGRYGSGFGLDNGKIKVRLDGYGFWSTNVSVTLGQWQLVTVTFNGTNAKLYVNGMLRASRTYTANADSLAGKNYRIGWGQSGSDTSTRTFFDGEIRNVQIFDRYDQTVSIDSTSPTVAGLSVNDTMLADADVGSGRFTITVTYNEAMKTLLAPTIAFTQTLDATLTFAGGTWTNSTHYMATYDVADANLEIADVGIIVSGAQDTAGNTQTSYTGSDNFGIDTLAPTATINQAATQGDPADDSPINFTVVFSEPVSDFAGGSVTLSGSAGADSATVTGSGTTYNVAVNGMTSDGTVLVSLPAGAAHDAAGNPSAASTSTDNMVTFTTPTHIWDGGGADNLWSTPENWTGDMAPIAGDSLVFPTGAAQLENVNDFDPGTVFVSIAFEGAGYHLSGNAIGLSAGIVDESSGTINIVAVDIDLHNSDLTIEVGQSLRIEGGIGGAGGVIKTGEGVLTLSGTNTYSGDTVVVAGELHTGRIETNNQPTTKVEVQANTILIAECIFTGNLTVGPGGILRIADTSNPTVTNVLVRSTQWDQSFPYYEGYSIPVGSGAQLTTLPWTNIDQIKVVFSENMAIDQDDLALSGVNIVQYDVGVGSFSYDPATFTATWTLAQAIGPDKLMVRLNADGFSPIQDASGNRLDGEWTNPTGTEQSSADTYPSGNGSAGGDFLFCFNVAPGDVDANDGVNLGDYLQTRAKSGPATGSAEYNVRFDVDGNGEINQDDALLARARLGNVLPSDEPVPGLLSAGSQPATSDPLPSPTNADDVAVVLPLVVTPRLVVPASSPVEKTMEKSPLKSLPEATDRAILWMADQWTRRSAESALDSLMSKRRITCSARMVSSALADSDNWRVAALHHLRANSRSAIGRPFDFFQ
jgi:autotransporter-associated beta strand protein